MGKSRTSSLCQDLVYDLVSGPFRAQMSTKGKWPINRFLLMWPFQWCQFWRMLLLMTGFKPLQSDGCWKRGKWKEEGNSATGSPLLDVLQWCPMAHSFLLEERKLLMSFLNPLEIFKYFKNPFKHWASAWQSQSEPFYGRAFGLDVGFEEAWFVRREEELVGNCVWN